MVTVQQELLRLIKKVKGYVVAEKEAGVKDICQKAPEGNTTKKRAK